MLRNLGDAVGPLPAAMAQSTHCNGVKMPKPRHTYILRNTPAFNTIFFITNAFIIAIIAFNLTVKNYTFRHK